MWRGCEVCWQLQVQQNPRGVPGCWKGDEHCSSWGSPGDVGGKRWLAWLCCFGQVWLPCSSDVGGFLISWNALFLHKGTFYSFCIACPKWDSLLLPSRWLFCLLSNLLIQMGLKFVITQKMSPIAKWQYSCIECWRWCTVFPGIDSKCMRAQRYLTKKCIWDNHCISLYLPWQTDKNLLTLPFAFLSFDPRCSRGRWYRSPVHTLQPGWGLLVPSRGGCSSTAGCLPPSQGQKMLHPHYPCRENSFPLAQRGDLHKGWLVLHSEVSCFFMSNMNLRRSWAVATIFWAILEIHGYWERLWLKCEWPALHSSR